MMASLNESDDEQFFDMHEEIDSVSDYDSDHSDDPSESSVSNDSQYKFWSLDPDSVHDRRSKFFEQMGLSVNKTLVPKKEQRGNFFSDGLKVDIDRVNIESGAVSRNSSDYSLFSRRSSMSCSSTEEDDLSTDIDYENDLVKQVGDLSISSSESSSDPVGKTGIMDKLHEASSSRFVKMGKFQKSGKNNVNGWLKQFRRKVQTVDTKREPSLKDGNRLRKTRVHLHKKKYKELSSLYEGQDFCAHEGLILAMKFSPDGRFLASAGEDGVVRVWNVIEEERDNNLGLQCLDPSCLHFLVNSSSKLVSVDIGKEINGKGRTFKKSPKPGCVIFPPKVFRIAEKPLHEFPGHFGEVLDLSWSSNEYLLSSSVDKTVRLWQLGHDECLRVFSHNNYVTCVEFNPVNDNYFISGSIDGKVRIWKINSCKVVHWIDIREIVTAVCYNPSGSKAIVGSMDGICRFYDIADNLMQLDSQIFLPGKKKSPCKRITGFQFSPSDSNRVLVSSADSQVRVLSGSNVIFKLKGPQMLGSQVTASFTKDGKHIVSGSQDSNIHVWDQTCSHIYTSASKAKKIGSYESFVSQNSSIAIPWCGIKTKSPRNDLLGSILRNVMSDTASCDTISSSSPDCFSRGREILMESWPKGTATWPEEKLTDSCVSPSVGRSEFQVLKGACESMSSSHMWGLVIVTAGRDGKIRTYHNYGLPIHL